MARHALRSVHAYRNMHGMHTATPANRLRELRDRNGVELIDVAFACRVHPSTVSRWQDGLIPQDQLATIAQLLNVSVPFLAGWSHVEEPFSAPGCESEPEAAAS